MEKYVRPEIKVIEMDIESAILESSFEGNGSITIEPGEENDQNRIMPRPSYSIWDD